MTRHALLAVALLGLGCTAHEVRGDAPAARPSEPATKPAAVTPAGSIAFVSARAGDLDVYRMRADGSDTVRLSSHAADDYLAPPSPLGALAVIRVSDDGAHREQLQLLAEGEPLLAAPSGRVRNPSWLPDGQSLVVERDVAGFRNLFRVWIDGRTPQRLTDAKEGSFEPAVSPDGRRVAFVSSRGGDAEIYTLDLESRATRRLTWSEGVDMTPVWSPDGRRLAFVSTRTGRPQPYTMNADGSAPTPVGAASDTVIGVVDVCWSPRGDALAWTEQSAGRASVVVRAADGKHIGRSGAAFVDQAPSWSPDGSALAFVSNRSGDEEIHRMRRDGSEVVQLTRSEGADWLPRWLP